MTEPWRWTKGLRLTPQEYMRLGRLLEVSDRLVDLSSDWAGIDITPAEIAQVDQVVAEADEEAARVLAELDGAADTAAQSGRQVELARELALELANQGDYGEAAEVAGTFGLPGIELAGGEFADVIELGNRAYASEATRAAEDSGPLPRGSEDRLQHLLSRVSRRTYTPQTQYTFASTSSAASTLARARWNQQADPMAAVTPGYPCGFVDAMGRCGEPYHSAGCSAIADPELVNNTPMREAMAQLAVRPMLDASGRAWQDQYGDPLTPAGYLEAATGQRSGGTLFETGHGHRELAAVTRQSRLGDPSDEDDLGTGIPRTTAATAARVAAQTGLATTPASAERERLRASPRRAADMARRAVRPGDGAESSRDRSARLAQPVTPATLRQVEEPADGLRGAVPMYRAG